MTFDQNSWTIGVKRFLKQDGVMTIGMSDQVQFKTGFNKFDNVTAIGAAHSGYSEMLRFMVNRSEFLEVYLMGLLISTLVWFRTNYSSPHHWTGCLSCTSCKTRPKSPRLALVSQGQLCLRYWRSGLKMWSCAALCFCCSVGRQANDEWFPGRTSRTFAWSAALQACIKCRAILTPCNFLCRQKWWNLALYSVAGETPVWLVFFCCRFGYLVVATSGE